MSARHCMKIVRKTLLFFLFAVLTLQAAYAACVPAQLRCGFFCNPLGMDSAVPRLDWILENDDVSARGLTQSAYQILVASSPESLAKDQGDLWDSGKVASAENYQIAYAGKSLKSDEAEWWKVRV